MSFFYFEYLTNGISEIIKLMNNESTHSTLLCSNPLPFSFFYQLILEIVCVCISFHTYSQLTGMIYINHKRHDIKTLSSAMITLSRDNSFFLSFTYITTLSCILLNFQLSSHTQISCSKKFVCLNLYLLFIIILCYYSYSSFE